MSTLTETVSNAGQGVLSINLNHDSTENASSQAEPAKGKDDTESAAMSKQSRSARPRPPVFENKEEER